jgi:hypothetical protein
VKNTSFYTCVVFEVLMKKESVQFYYKSTGIEFKEHVKIFIFVLSNNFISICLSKGENAGCQTGMTACMGEQSIRSGWCQLLQSLTEKWRDLFWQCTSSRKRHRAILLVRIAGATDFGTAVLFRGVSGVAAASRQMTQRDRSGRKTFSTTSRIFRHRLCIVC